MKYQVHVAFYLLKKDFFKLLVIFFMLLISMIVTSRISPYDPQLMEINDMLTERFSYIIGIRIPKNIDFLVCLWLSFQIFFTTYISYRFLLYENDNSPEFLLLRKKISIFLVNKLLMLTIITTIIRLVTFFVSFFILKKYISFSFNLFLDNIIIYLLLSYFVYIIFLFYKYCTFLKRNGVY